jgi:hypothetical protein
MDGDKYHFSIKADIAAAGRRRRGVLHKRDLSPPSGGQVIRLYVAEVDDADKDGAFIGDWYKPSEKLCQYYELLDQPPRERAHEN